MIKSWQLDNDSDHDDLLTYAWLEITKVRIELNELEHDLKIHASGVYSSVESKNLLKDYKEVLDNVHDWIRFTDEVVNSAEKENRETPAWSIYSHHRWVECERVAKLYTRIEDISDGIIEAPAKAHKRKIIH